MMLICNYLAPFWSTPKIHKLLGEVARVNPRDRRELNETTRNKPIQAETQECQVVEIRSGFGRHLRLVLAHLCFGVQGSKPRQCFRRPQELKQTRRIRIIAEFESVEALAEAEFLPQWEHSSCHAMVPARRRTYAI